MGVVIGKWSESCYTNGGLTFLCWWRQKQVVHKKSYYRVFGAIDGRGKYIKKQWVIRGEIYYFGKRVWNGELLEVGNQCITGRFTGVNEDFSCYITSVYADCNREVREVLWEEVRGVKNKVNGPWTICGDFNVTRYRSERKNCNTINGSMSVLSACIEELEMINPLLFGGSFTWRRGEDHTCASRIEDSCIVLNRESDLHTSSKKYNQN